MNARPHDDAPREGQRRTAPNAACEAYRAAFLEQRRPADVAAGADAHASSCEGCARWSRSQAAVAAALAGGPDAPATLDARVALELEEPGVRFARAFARQAAATAPAALDEAVAGIWRPKAAPEDLADWERRSPLVQALREQGLRSPAVPAVLDRLVGEELRQPDATMAARYVGGLSPLSAPEELAERLARLDAAEPRRAGRRVAGARLGAGLASAAALLLLLVLETREEPERAAGTGLRVVVVDDPAAIDPAVRSLLGALNGGVLPGEAR